METITTNIPMTQIANVMCKYFNVEREVLFSKRREKKYVDARHHLIWYTSKYGEFRGSPSKIAGEYRRLGGQMNHSNVIHSVNKINDLLFYSSEEHLIISELDVIIDIRRKQYLTIHYFLKQDKGTVTSIRYDKQTKILWKHNDVKMRGNRMYLKGDIKKDGEAWKTVDNELFLYEGLICVGSDAEKVFI